MYVTFTMIYYITHEEFCKGFSSLLNPYMNPMYIVCWNGNLWRVFLTQILQKAVHRPTKVLFCSYKQVSGRNGDHEWLRMTIASILCDLLWKVQKCQAVNREGSFKFHGMCCICDTFNRAFMRLWIQSLNQSNNFFPQNPYSTWKCHICNEHTYVRLFTLFVFADVLLEYTS